MKAFVTAVTNTMRSAGQSLDSVGKALENHVTIEKLQPSLRCRSLGAQKPAVKSAFIAPSATLVGNIKVGSNTAFWYDSVVRGDVGKISIGDRTIVGDRCMVHVSGAPVNSETIIGDDVNLGAGSIIHGCKIGNKSTIGEGSTIMDHAKIGENVIIGAGSFVATGKEIPSGQYWAGIPAKYQRDVLPEELEKIKDRNVEELEWAAVHADEQQKTWEMIEDEEFDWNQEVDRGPDYYRRLPKEEWAARLGTLHDGSDAPGRLFDMPHSGRNDDPYLEKNAAFRKSNDVHDNKRIQSPAN